MPEASDIDAIIKEYAGKGTISFPFNREFPYEYVSLDQNIGKVYNVGEKKYMETDRVAIVYSSKGVHLYPVKNW